MKKLILALCLAIFPAMWSLSQPAQQDTIYTTNLYVFSPKSGGPYNLTNSYMRLYRAGIITWSPSGANMLGAVDGNIRVSTTNTIDLISAGGTTNLVYLEAPGGVKIVGDLSVSGTVTAATNVLTVTNTVAATNLFLFTNNTQTAAVNLSLPYGNLTVDGTTTVGLGIDPTSKVADNYQTAVVIIKNTGTKTNIDNIASGTMHIQGTPWVTNRSIATIFYHGIGGDVFTNMIVLPLW